MVYAPLAAALLALMSMLALASAARAPLEFTVIDPLTIHALRRRSISSEVAMRGIPATAYTMPIALGTYPQNFTVVMDTGSSNLAVAGAASAGITPYFATGSSTTFANKGDAIAVSYVQGSWSGTRGSDVIQVFGSGIAAATADFAAITSASNFFGTTPTYTFQGIFGLAYKALAFPAESPVTPLFDVWVSHGVTNSFAMQLCDPYFVSTATSQTLVSTPSFVEFGAQAADVSDAASGAFFYAPIYEAKYYGVLITGMAIGGQSLGVACSLYNSPSAAIVDSGTSNLYVPQAAFDAIVSALSAAISFPSASSRSNFFNGYIGLIFSDAGISSLPSITVTLAGTGGTEFDLTIQPWHYMRPLSLSNSTGIALTSHYRVFAITPSCGTIMGIALMGSYTVVFDRANSRVGFARSTCSNSSGFSSVPAIVSRSSTASCSPDTSVCASTTSSTSSTGIIVGAIIGGAVVLGIIGALVFWLSRPSSRPAVVGRPV